MKVYLHGNFWFLSTLVPYPCYFFDDPCEVPNGCDLVGYSNFGNQDVESHVEMLCTKSRAVLFDWNEVRGQEFADRERALHCQYHNLQIFSTVLTNYSSRLLFSGCWFIAQQNYYAADDARPWADLLIHQLEYRQERPKIIDCLLGRLTPCRNFIENCYNTLPTWQKDLIQWSYWKDDITKGCWTVDVNGLTQSSEPVALPNPGSCVIDHVAPSAILPVHLYNRSWFSLITESLVFDSFSFFTEKTAKPLVAGRLFVCFAGQYFLRNLRRLGFRTFDGIIDESYDAVEQHEQRWHLAWQQILWLLAQDPVDIYAKSREICQHNQWYFRNTDWSSAIKQHALPLLLPDHTGSAGGASSS